MEQEAGRNGARTTYGYDSLNRILKTNYNGSIVNFDQYTYDRNGNIVKLQSQNATLAYTYDSRNRVICEGYFVNSAGGPCGGGGGSVAAGTLITMADGLRVPVQNLKAGDRLLSYNVTSGQFTVSTVTRMAVVQTSNMLIIRTQDPLDLRTDNATIQKLYVMKADGTVGWLPVTELRVGDYLFKALDHRWTMVTNIDYVPGSFTMYDVYTSAPYNYLADGYLDPPKIPQTPGGTLSAVYAIGYFYNGEVVSQITHNDALAIQYSYDGLGRVFDVTGSLGYGTYLARFSYYPNDQVKGVQYGNGIVANYTYDEDSRSSQIKLTNGTTTYLLLNYQYYNTGVVASVSGQSRTTTGSTLAISESYKYDSLGRLTNSTTTSGSIGTGLWYQYDALGNRAVQGLNGSATGYRWATTTYGYNPANNELLNSTSNGVTTRYGYNPNGDLSTKNVDSTHWTYAWDIQGDLLSVGNDSGVQGYYAYDGLGRRVEAKEGSSLLYYAYQGTETMFEHTTSGADVDYAFANGLRIAKVTGYGGTNPTVVYYHTDVLGNTRLMTSSSRNVIFSDSYQPFGQDNAASGSETYKFTGKPVSAATGLYYYQRRYSGLMFERMISRGMVREHT